MNLTLDMTLKFRHNLARFRCSSHKLGIEIGRHSGIDRENRICLYCFNKYRLRIIEDEYHVFFSCSKYRNIRSSHLYSWYNGRDDIISFYNILQNNNPCVIRKVAIYITKIFDSL